MRTPPEVTISPNHLVCNLYSNGGSVPISDSASQFAYLSEGGMQYSVSSMLSYKNIVLSRID